MTAVTPPDADLAAEAESPEMIRAKIISETARINWLELQKFFAAGSVITVADSLDLVEVAFNFHQDNKQQVANWLQQELVQRTTEAQAQHWFSEKAELWAVVVSPWILVQDKHTASQLN